MEKNNKEYEKKWKLYEKGEDFSKDILREVLIKSDSEYSNLSNEEFISALIKDVTKNGGPQHQRYLTEEQGLEMIQELNDNNPIPELDIYFKPSTFRIREEINDQGDSFYTVAIKGKDYEEVEAEYSFNKIENYLEHAVSGIKKFRLKVPFENDLNLEIDYIPKLDLLLVEVEVEAKKDSDAIEKLNNLPDFGEDVSEDDNYSIRILSEFPILKEYLQLVDKNES